MEAVEKIMVGLGGQYYYKNIAEAIVSNRLEGTVEDLARSASWFLAELYDEFGFCREEAERAIAYHIKQELQRLSIELNL
jgi:hypothetical protein